MKRTIGPIFRLAARLDRFMLAILAAVVIATLLPVRGSAATVMSALSQALVALLFFLYGARLSTQAAWEGVRHWRLHLTVLACTFALFPIIGLAARGLEPRVLTPELYFGVMYLCVLPSTVQSSIAFTSIARGNVAAAICAASFSNLAGVFLTPVLASLFLGSRVQISPESVGRIAAQLLLPFVLGQLARPRISTYMERHPVATTLVDRGSVVLVVYTAFSAGVVAGVWHRLGGEDLATVVVVDAVLLALVLVLTTQIARRLGMARADQIVVTFCGSKKSIATGIPMATVLFAGANVSLIVLPAMIFHQIQLMTCAVLARRYLRQDESMHGSASSTIAEATA
jgi:sodium/bile acid cotransporter 7